MIDAKKLNAIFIDCLFNMTELVNGEPTIPQIIVNGIFSNFVFHPDRLKSHTTEIKEMLNNLPLNFQPSSKRGGGGMSILNMCNDKNDVQWGEHENVEQLCVLSIGLDLACFPPKSMWNALPGGLPYFCIKE
jgi:hypothetical protein